MNKKTFVSLSVCLGLLLIFSSISIQNNNSNNSVYVIINAFNNSAAESPPNNNETTVKEDDDDEDKEACYVQPESYVYLVCCTSFMKKLVRVFSNLLMNFLKNSSGN